MPSRWHDRRVEDAGAKPRDLAHRSSRWVGSTWNDRQGRDRRRVRGCDLLLCTRWDDAAAAARAGAMRVPGERRRCPGTAPRGRCDRDTSRMLRVGGRGRRRAGSTFGRRSTWNHGRRAGGNDGGQDPGAIRRASGRAGPAGDATADRARGSVGVPRGTRAGVAPVHQRRECPRIATLARTLWSDTATPEGPRTGARPGAAKPRPGRFHVERSRSCSAPSRATQRPRPSGQATKIQETESSPQGLSTGDPRVA